MSNPIDNVELLILGKINPALKAFVGSNIAINCFNSQAELTDYICTSRCSRFLCYLDATLQLFDPFFIIETGSPLLPTVALTYCLNQGQALVNLDANFNLVELESQSPAIVHDGFCPSATYFVSQDFVQQNKGSWANLSQHHYVGLPLPYNTLGPSQKCALFLDRDGVIIKDTGYIKTPNEIQIFPEVIDLITFANQKQWPVIVLSNQSGVARGFFSTHIVEEINNEIAHRLSLLGAKIDFFDYCPFHLEGSGEFKKQSILRKPMPGMLLRSCQNRPIDLKSSIMLGDRKSDAILMPGITNIHIQRDHDLSGQPYVFDSYQAIIDWLRLR